MDKWQPIETAPKGQKIIGGYYNSAGKWRSFFCEYIGKHEMEVEHPIGDDPSDHTDDAFFAPEGWYECCEGDEEGAWRVRPIMWQPLPSPPQQEGE